MSKTTLKLTILGNSWWLFHLFIYFFLLELYRTDPSHGFGYDYKRRARIEECWVHAIQICVIMFSPSCVQLRFYHLIYHKQYNWILCYSIINDNIIIIKILISYKWSQLNIFVYLTFVEQVNNLWFFFIFLLRFKNNSIFFI